MLKVVSDTLGEVFDFVVHYKNAMSQTTLRYAIEKIPTYLRIYPYKAVTMLVMFQNNAWRFLQNAVL